MTLEGFADAYSDPIVAVEISMDRGATWTSFDVSDTNRKNWVYWNFTYTPQAAGAYVLSLRGVTEDGKILINDPVSSYKCKRAFPEQTLLTQARNGEAFMICWTEEEITVAEQVEIPEI